MAQSQSHAKKRAIASAGCIAIGAPKTVFLKRNARIRLASAAEKLKYNNMASLAFETTIEILGVNPYVLVSKERAAILKPGWRKPIPVLVQINGKPDNPWHINMMPVGDGSFYLYLHGDVRKASQTKVGDRVSVEVSFDSRYKPVPSIPLWIRKALNEHQTAKKNWYKLTPSRQKEIIRYLSNLKSEEARERNLERALDKLSGESGRFMARTWNNGQ